MNKYEIRTIREFTDVVTSDNIEFFVHDIRDFLLAILSAKQVFGTNVTCEKLIWIDDKKHNKTINVRIEKSDRKGNPMVEQIAEREISRIAFEKDILFLEDYIIEMRKKYGEKFNSKYKNSPQNVIKQYLIDLLWKIEYAPDDTGIEYQYLSVVGNYLEKLLSGIEKKKTVEDN